MEEWRDIEGFEGLYQVSNLGRVKSVERTVYRKGVGGCDSWKPVGERILRCNPDSNGYPSTTLSKDGKRMRGKVHIWVARAFIGPPPPGQEVRHRDGDRSNPALSNLVYGTRKENMADAVEHGTVVGVKNGHSKLTEEQVREIRARRSVHAEDLAPLYSVSKETIRNVWAGRTYSSVI